MPATLTQYQELADRLEADDRTPVRATDAIRHLLRALELAARLHGPAPSDLNELLAASENFDSANK